MRNTSLAALFLSSFLLGGCNAALWGNLFVVAVTVGVFCGTLFLGSGARGASATASASSSTTGHS